MTPAQRAMATWLGALSRSGVVHAEGDEAAGEAVAAYVVGSDALSELKRWFRAASAPDAARERRAAVEACILMAHADREVQPEERELLEDIVARSALPDADQAVLGTVLASADTLEGLGARLTQPVLCELILALAWELALADERIDPAEASFFARLARALAIPSARAEEIKGAVSERLG